MKPIQPLQVRLPRQIHDWLRQKAFDTRKSINSIIVTLLEKAKDRDK